MSCFWGDYVCHAIGVLRPNVLFCTRKEGRVFFSKDVFCISECQSVDMFSAQELTGSLPFPSPMFIRFDPSACSLSEWRVQNCRVPTGG